MDYKHCYVVDADGRYLDFVLVLLEPNEVGGVEERIQHYILAEGERLIDAQPPAVRPHAGAAGLVSPRWDGTDWVEAATAAEAAAWEAAHPAPAPDTTPTLDQRTAALEGAVLALLGGEAHA